MRFRSIISLLLCFSLIWLLCGFVSSADTDQSVEKTTDENVITESDAGGGDIGTRELLALLILMVTAIVIVAIAV